MQKLPDLIELVLRRLHDAGYEAYIVGGCVRDSLLGLVPQDYDVTTSALPEEVEAVFADYSVIETGLKHGTVTVLIDHIPVEITTFRTESVYSDHRHPDQVAFTRNLREDAARRDFTMNAMAYCEETGLMDYFGGQEDLKAGVIRCVGVAEERFREDALRILRALRFSARFGFRIEEKTAKAAHDCRELLRFVSAERIASELVKILCGKYAKQIILEFPDVLGVVIPELIPMVGYDQRNPHHCFDLLTHTAITVAEVPPVPTLRLAALLHDIGKPACFFTDEKGIGHYYGHPEVSADLAEEILRRLKLDNATRKTVVQLVRHHDMVIVPSEKAVRRAIAKITPELFWDLMTLKRADSIGTGRTDDVRMVRHSEVRSLAEEIFQKAHCFSLRDLAIGGRDLIACGMKPGKEIGALLDDLFEAVLSGEVENKKDVLLKLAKEKLA